MRSLALPEILTEELSQHIDQYAEPGPEGLLFRGPKGAALRRSNFGRSTKWTTMVTAVGLPVGFHFHDLRHTGNQLTAASGATTRELMHRMGHGSMRAALIYQHATSARDRTIATALNALVTADRQTATHPDQTNQQDGGEQDSQPGTLTPTARNGT